MMNWDEKLLIIEYAPIDDYYIRIQHNLEYPRHDVKIMYDTSTSPTKVKHTKYQIRYKSVRTILHPVSKVPVPSLKVIASANFGTKKQKTAYLVHTKCTMHLDPNVNITSS